MPDLSDADPVEYVHDWLRNHPATATLLGGPDHVSGIPEAPWPHVVASDGLSGDLRGMVWEAEFEVTLEVIGAPDGSPGQAALRKIAMQLLKAVVDAPEDDRPTATDPVVSRARPSGVFAWSPMSNGQPRYTIGVMVTIRPPRVAPPA